MSTVTFHHGRRLLTHIPPEGVPIGFTIASLGSRFGAQTLDIVLTYGGAFLVLLLLLWVNLLSWTALASLFVLMIFLVRIPYYILSELVWNGRTLGKRITGIRVISGNGRRLTPHQIVARNLMKEVEIFTPVSMIFAFDQVSNFTRILLAVWLMIIIIVPFANKRRQRLGDLIAGTLVVDRPRATLLPDLSATAVTSRRGYEFRAEHLDHYGRYELQTLEEILRNPPSGPEARARVSDVAQTILRKIRYDEKVPQAREWDFLMEFYRQQREYLENRHLFGDSRENKFHTRDDGGT